MNAVLTRFQSTHSLRSATCERKETTMLLPKFQSTHSLRSATCILHLAEPVFQFQSTHSLRSATGQRQTWTGCLLVSIHALLAECDQYFDGTFRRHTGFNPRTPCGVRLFASCRFRMPSGCFNPRTPCGVRPDLAGKIDTVRQFQSTHSLRSATRLPLPGRQRASVSIHALLAECDKIKGHSVTC